MQPLVPGLSLTDNLLLTEELPAPPGETYRVWFALNVPLGKIVTIKIYPDGRIVSLEPGSALVDVPPVAPGPSENSWGKPQPTPPTKPGWGVSGVKPDFEPPKNPEPYTPPSTGWGVSGVKPDFEPPKNPEPYTPPSTDWGVSGEKPDFDSPKKPEPDIPSVETGWEKPAEEPAFVPPQKTEPYDALVASIGWGVPAEEPAPPSFPTNDWEKPEQPASDSPVTLNPDITGNPVNGPADSKKEEEKDRSLLYMLLGVLLVSLLGGGGYWYWLQENQKSPATDNQPANSLIDTTTSDSWSSQEPVHSDTLTPTDASGFEIATDTASTRSEPAPTISSTGPDLKTAQTPDRPTSKDRPKKTAPKASREKPTFATDAELNN